MHYEKSTISMHMVTTTQTTIFDSVSCEMQCFHDAKKIVNQEQFTAK